MGTQPRENGWPPRPACGGESYACQFIIKLQQSVYRARREAIELPALVRKADRDYERDIRAELLQEHLAALRKERAHSGEKPKKPAPKNGAPNSTVQPVPSPSQSSSIKANQASHEPLANQTAAPTIGPLPVMSPVLTSDF